jgi:hypothetical protein
MKGLMLAFAVALCISTPTAYAQELDAAVFEDGILEATAPASTTGSLTFSTSTVPNFSLIVIIATGVPILLSPDLSTTNVDVSTASGFSGTHTLTVDIFQTGIAAIAGTSVTSKFTVSNTGSTLPGPSLLEDFFNGTTSSLGTLLDSHNFPAGTAAAIFGPDPTKIAPAITADAHEYEPTFTGANQVATDTIQLIAIREPGSLALLGTGLLGVGLALRTHRKGRSGDAARA